MCGRTTRSTRCCAATRLRNPTRSPCAILTPRSPGVRCLTRSSASPPPCTPAACGVATGLPSGCQAASSAWRYSWRAHATAMSAVRRCTRAIPRPRSSRCSSACAARRSSRCPAMAQRPPRTRCLPCSPRLRSSGERTCWARRTGTAHQPLKMPSPTPTRPHCRATWSRTSTRTRSPTWPSLQAPRACPKGSCTATTRCSSTGARWCRTGTMTATRSCCRSAP